MDDLVSPEQDAPDSLTEVQARQLVLRTVATQAESLLRVAHRHSLCADDAHDAYQRSMEIFMRRARTLDPERASNWLHVVVKREAWAVREARSDVLAEAELDADHHEAVHLASPEEQALSAERVTRAAEALQRLKPQELQAMWLKASGSSYRDAGGNETSVARSQALRVDNQAPATPIGLTSPGASSPTNSFSASWSLPADAGSPISAARYQVCSPMDGCGPIQTAPSLTGVSGLALPAAGTHALRVWLVDQVGHESAAGAAAIGLTYAPPAQSQPSPLSAPEPAPPLSAPDLPAALPPASGLGPIPGPRPTAKAPARLRISSVRRVGRRVKVAGRISSTASGRLTVSYRVRIGGHARRASRRAPIRRGAFHITLTLPASLAHARSATVLVAYGGDPDTAAATRSAALTVRR